MLALSLFVAFVYKRVAADGQSYKGKAKTTGSGTGSDRDFSGESLYTGDVAFSAPITEIGGIGVALTYNSNVHKLVRADNAVLQAGWVGLGWTLNLGSITADINNTRDVSDDRYFFVDAAGGSELILQSGNSFRLKDYQYWLITRHLDASGNLIGWTIIREDGTIYRYGNYDKTTENFITHNIGVSPKSINVWHWNGTNWGNGITYNDTDPDKGVFPGDNYFAFLGHDQAFIKTWTGDPGAPWSQVDISTPLGISSTSFKNGKAAVGGIMSPSDGLIAAIIITVNSASSNT